jgi:hypothetical protein
MDDAAFRRGAPAVCRVRRRHRPASVDPQHADELFAFVAWALVHEPEGLADRFAYENVMRDQGFTEHKSVFVHTAIVVARPIVTAYEGERANV